MYNHLNDKLPRVERGSQIPKLLHQTWVCRSTNELPERIIANIEYLKQLNPTWEYHLWEDSSVEAFIREHYGQEIWLYYTRISARYGAAKADFFRYLVIYKLGGVYLDIKTSLTRPLDESINSGDKLLLSYWDNLPGEPHHTWGHYPELRHLSSRGEFPQWYIACTAGHPFFRNLILRVMHNIDRYSALGKGVGLRGVLRTTGTIVYSLAMHEERLKDPENRLSKVVNGFEQLGLIYSIYEADQGAFGHKQAIKQNYNIETSPVILNGNAWQSRVFGWYFRLQIYWYEVVEKGIRRLINKLLY
ncbi:MAG: glycosyltransferase [Porphyromonadaceae bacterium]|nr:glycosyltransferase [Porphyromonadaceae bacterium]